MEYKLLTEDEISQLKPGAFVNVGNGCIWEIVRFYDGEPMFRTWRNGGWVKEKEHMVDVRESTGEIKSFFAVKRDDMLNDNDIPDLWYAEESNLELIPPAPAKPEYHKNQRVWLHVCGEVFPATFRKYTNNAITSSGGRCCVVERDDKLDGGSKHHHWLMGEEYLEPMPDAEDPRKEHL
jgi:hypothetical protein